MDAEAGKGRDQVPAVADVSNVIPLGLKLVAPSVKVAPRKIFAGARAAQLQEAVALGWDQDGNMYLASSEGPADTLWLLEAAKAYLMNGCQ